MYGVTPKIVSKSLAFLSIGWVCAICSPRLFTIDSMRSNSSSLMSIFSGRDNDRSDSAVHSEDFLALIDSSSLQETPDRDLEAGSPKTIRYSLIV